VLTLALWGIALTGFVILDGTRRGAFPFTAAPCLTGSTLVILLILCIALYSRKRTEAVKEAYQAAVVAFALGRKEGDASAKGNAQG
jgi:hypothetical protein